VKRYRLFSDVAADVDIEAAFEWYESEQPAAPCRMAVPNLTRKPSVSLQKWIEFLPCAFELASGLPVI
jgi:hypothetical protein